jgi:hypothetical protein
MYNTESIAATEPLRRRSAVINNNTHSEKSVGYEMTAQLFPFKATMKKQLRRRGLNVDFIPFKLLVPLYYNELVSNKNNSSNNLVPINCFEFANNPAFKVSLNDEINGDLLSHRNVQYFNQVASITDEIINNFKKSKLKKESLGLGSFDVSKAMTDDELMQAKTAIKVEKNLESALIGNKPITIKTIKNLFVIGIIIYLLWYMSK